MAATGGDLRSPASVPVPHQREGQHRVRAQGRAARHDAERERLVHEAVRWARLEHLLGFSRATGLSAGEKAARGARPGTRTEAATVSCWTSPRRTWDAESRLQAVALIRDLLRFRRRRTDSRCHDQQIIQLPGMCRLHLQAGRIRAQRRPAAGSGSIRSLAVRWGKLPLHRRRACGGRPSRTTRIRQKNQLPPQRGIRGPDRACPCLPVQHAPGRCSLTGVAHGQLG